MAYIHREQERAYKRAWYVKNRHRLIQENIERRRRFKVWFDDFKSKLRCSHCDENDPICLDFHHTDPSKKDLEVSRLVNHQSRKRLLAELEKCITLCINCHAKEHRRLRGETKNKEST